MNVRLEYNLGANPLDTFHFREPPFISADRSSIIGSVVAMPDIPEDALLASRSVPMDRQSRGSVSLEAVASKLLGCSFQATTTVIPLTPIAIKLAYQSIYAYRAAALGA